MSIIVLGFAEALSAPEVVWSLVDEGFNLIAFARRGRPSALRHSKHIVCHDICPPEDSVEAALADLHSLLATLGRETNGSKVIFPLDDKAVWLCNSLQLDEGWFSVGPSGAAADLALNKYLQVQAARAAGFAVPRTSLARSADEVYAFVSDKSFPIILKASECVPLYKGRIRGSHNWICANEVELEHAVSQWAEDAPLVVQPFITGSGEGVFGIAAPDGIRAWSAHRRLRMMNPQGSGSSACISQPVPQEIRQKVESLIESAKWRGLFMVELLRDHAGTAWFVELNGRPWGSMALSRRVGLEYPAWHVKLAIDQHSKVGIGRAQIPGVVCRHLGREIMHLLFVLRGPKSRALSEWPSIVDTVISVARVRRGDRFYNWRSDELKLFIADCFYTIKDNVFKSTH